MCACALVRGGGECACVHACVHVHVGEMYVRGYMGVGVKR